VKVAEPTPNLLWGYQVNRVKKREDSSLLAGEIPRTRERGTNNNNKMFFKFVVF
jgi:hypothetical protein